MGKTSEQYYVQRGGKWVPVRMGDDSDTETESDTDSDDSTVRYKRSAQHQYYVQREGKWVKVGGIKSKQDLIDKLGGKSQQQLQRYTTTTTEVAPQPVVHAPQAPLEHREYFITVIPPPPEPEPVRVENEYVQEPPPRPIPQRRPPPQRVPPPIVPQPRPVIMRPPPPAPIVQKPPDIYHVHHHHYPPPPPMEPLPPPLPPPPPPQPETVMVPNPEWDAFEMGRRAFYEQGAYEEEDDVDMMPRTTPAPGYYLAGYLYYGDPSTAPELRPMPGM